MAMKPKKKVSKKSKASWRKYSNIADVEEYLEEVRRDERTGGPAADKADEELFFVHKDTKPVASQCRRTAKQKKELKRKFSNAVSTVKHSTKDDTETSVQASVKTASLTDLWMSQEKVTGSDEAEEVFALLTRRNVPKQPKHRAKSHPTAPAVELPAAGSSYNPTYDDHQSLVQKATAIEVEKFRKRQRVDRFAASLPVMNHLEREKTWINEMSAGLQVAGEGSEIESESEPEDCCRGDEEAPAAGKVVRADYRKSTKQRRKEEEQRKSALQRRLLKKSRAQENDVYRLRSIKKEIRCQEETIKNKEKVNAEKRSKKTERLGPYQYQEAEVDVQLSEELAGSFRRLKPEGNLFRDRFHSLERRKMLETRRRVVPHRKYKLKQYTKEAFKTDDWPLKTATKK